MVTKAPWAVSGMHRNGNIKPLFFPSTPHLFQLTYGGGTTCGEQNSAL